MGQTKPNLSADPSMNIGNHGDVLRNYFHGVWVKYTVCPCPGCVPVRDASCPGYVPVRVVSVRVVSVRVVSCPGCVCPGSVVAPGNQTLKVSHELPPPQGTQSHDQGLWHYHD